MPMDFTSRMQCYMHFQLQISNWLEQTKLYGLECWGTEVEQISSTFKRLYSHTNPLVAGATNKPGEWQIKSI